MDIDLKFPGFVDWRIEQSKKALANMLAWTQNDSLQVVCIADLVGNVGASITDIAIHFAHNANVFITIQ